MEASVHQLPCAVPSPLLCVPRTKAIRPCLLPLPSSFFPSSLLPRGTEAPLVPPRQVPIGSTAGPSAPRLQYEDPASSNRLAPLAARVTPELSAQQAAAARAAEAGPSPSPEPVRIPQRRVEDGYVSGTAGSWVEGFRQSPSLLAVQDVYSQELRRLVGLLFSPSLVTVSSVVR